MGPALGTGSVVEVVRKKIYFPGDIVVGHRRDGLLVSHRLLVMYRKGGVWKALTKADNHSTSDASISIDNILGCVKTNTGIPIRVRCKSLIGGVVVLGRCLTLRGRKE